MQSSIYRKPSWKLQNHPYLQSKTTNCYFKPEVCIMFGELPSAADLVATAAVDHHMAVAPAKVAVHACARKVSPQTAQSAPRHFRRNPPQVTAVAGARAVVPYVRGHERGVHSSTQRARTKINMSRAMTAHAATGVEPIRLPVLRAVFDGHKHLLLRALNRRFVKRD